jgi:hypothetical protein
VLGRELIPFEQEKRYIGIIRPNRGAQQLFNYAASASVEVPRSSRKRRLTSTRRKSKATKRGGIRYNTRNWPFLPRYKFNPDNGQPFGPVGRVQADTSKMAINAMLLQQAGDFIHAGTSAHEPTLGEHS